MARLPSKTSVSTLTLLLSATAAYAAPPYPIHTKPYEWRTDYHDATNTTLARDTLINWDNVFANRASVGVAGASAIQVRRNYVYLHDNDGAVRLPWRTTRDLSDSFEWALGEIYSVLPMEFAFVYLFTSFETGIGAYFYQHQYNETEGIGLPAFDNNGPNNPLEGFVFMNYYRSFEDMWGRFGDNVVLGFGRHTFNQEAGHRWIVANMYGPDVRNGTFRKLLGRDESHWSWFMHSGGSPMEGNDWRQNNMTSFTTRTTYNNWRFSDLDLYLMGLKAESEVASWFVVDNPTVTGTIDLRGQTPDPESPPQIINPVTISGTRLDVGIGDVTRALGRRWPESGRAPNRWRVVFVMLASQGAPLAESQRAEFEDLVDLYAAGFREGTGGRGDLDYALMPTSKLPIGSPCASAADCNPAEATMCATPQHGGQTFCTRPCATAAGCPQSWCCAPDRVTQQSVCHSPDLCRAPPMQDAGFVDSGEQMTQADSGMGGGGGGGGGGTCACDKTVCCDRPNGVNCDCDPECVASAACACDKSFDCDEGCGCDPDCGVCAKTNLPATRSASCTCLATPPPEGAGARYLALLLGGAAIFLLRRRS